MSDLQSEEDSKSQFRYRSGLIIYPSQSSLIQKALKELFEKIPANFVLLADTIGELITSYGELNPSKRAVLGSLIASNLIASYQINRLVDESRKFQMIMLEGNANHIFIIGIGLKMVLCVKVSDKISLEWARLTIKQGANLLHDIIQNPPKN